MTLSKLAKLCSVSISTASKAFSGSPDVNEMTREMIFRTAKEHGVFKKFYNVKYPRLAIAVIVPEFNSRHYGPLLHAISALLEERGCVMSVAESNFLPEESEKMYDYFSIYTDVDGIIVIDSLPESCAAPPIPCAVIGRANPSKSTAIISLNTECAIREILTDLKERGVRTVGFISEKKTVSKYEKVAKLATEIIGSFDPEYSLVTEGRFEEGGYEGMTELIKRGRVAEAIFCGYDNMAYGAMRALYDNGICVPDRVALIGFDNNNESRFISPSLTSIDTCTDECAEALVSAVIDMILGKPHAKSVTLRAALHRRESTDVRLC